jgi:hypothetical protein
MLKIHANDVTSWEMIGETFDGKPWYLGSVVVMTDDIEGAKDDSCIDGSSWEIADGRAYAVLAIDCNDPDNDDTWEIFMAKVRQLRADGYDVSVDTY